MANNATTAREPREPHDFAPDVLGVKSRVSWSAIIAGTVIALACYLVLTLLFAAIGISLTAGAHADGGTVGWGFLIAMLLSLIASLFVGGAVASQLTAGENRQESVIYGLLTWAAFTAISLGMVGMGIRAGYFAVVGGSMVAQNNERIPAWEDAAKQAGVPDQQIADAKAKIDPARAREMANDPENQRKAEKAAITASWTALVATMLGMAAAVGGAMCGCGPTFRLFPVVQARRTEPSSPLIIPTA